MAADGRTFHLKEILNTSCMLQSPGKLFKNSDAQVPRQAVPEQVSHLVEEQIFFISALFTKTLGDHTARAAFLANNPPSPLRPRGSCQRRTFHFPCLMFTLTLALSSKQSHTAPSPARLQLPSFINRCTGALNPVLPSLTGHCLTAHTDGGESVQPAL